MSDELRMKDGRTNNVTLEKAEAFALRVVKLYQILQGQHESVMSKQMLRSGTSIGANITEGHYAASKADFINKYVIARKEAAETLYWLRLLIKSGYLVNDEMTQSLVSACDEIVRLLVASIKTARQNMEAASSHHAQPHATPSLVTRNSYFITLQHDRPSQPQPRPRRRPLVVLRDDLRRLPFGRRHQRIHLR